MSERRPFDARGMQLHVALALPAALRLKKCDPGQVAGAGPEQLLAMFEQKGCSRPVQYLSDPAYPLMAQERVRHYWLAEGRLDYDTHTAVTFKKWLDAAIFRMPDEEMRSAEHPLRLLNECAYIPADVVKQTRTGITIATVAFKYAATTRQHGMLVPKTVSAPAQQSSFLQKILGAQGIHMDDVVGKHWSTIFPGLAPRIDYRHHLAAAFNGGDWKTLGSVCYAAEGIETLTQLEEAARAHAARPAVLR